MTDGDFVRSEDVSTEVMFRISRFVISDLRFPALLHESVLMPWHSLRIAEMSDGYVSISLADLLMPLVEHQAAPVLWAWPAAKASHHENNRMQPNHQYTSPQMRRTR